LALFPDVVVTTSNLASDAAGVAAHMAPEAADAGTPAPDFAPANAGEVVETCPQVDANVPLQLIREICNRVSYPHASKRVRVPHGLTQGWLRSVPLQLVLGKQ
jgi:hypothetical protein